MTTIGTRQANSPAPGFISAFDWLAFGCGSLSLGGRVWGFLTGNRGDLPFATKGAVWTDTLERQVTKHLENGTRFRF